MALSLNFLGAADGVTGSRTIVAFNKHKWLVDCGLFQGPKAVRDRNRLPFEPDPSIFDKIILTHAHLDHSGYLPRIFEEGYQGEVYCTEGTFDLCHILLRDAAHIEEETAQFANATKYSHHNPALPLFTGEQAEVALSHLKSFPRDVWTDLAEGVRFRFLRAGHIIGASILQFEFRDQYHSKILTCSGDVGHNRSFVLKGPEEGIETDYLVLEGTYGDRKRPHTDVLEAFAEIYNRTVKRHGVLVIPAFAVGRAQEVTYMIRLLEDQGRIPVVPVILDSPMSVAAMDICMTHDEDRIIGEHGISAEVFKPHRFEVSLTSDQSMLTCMKDGPMVVISASGMLSGGRILHHLKHRLPDERNTVLFCGYQAEGTKGRYLQENAGKIQDIRIHHEVVPIAADIATIEHLSAHADQSELLAWLSRMRKLPKLVIVNHGDPLAQKALASLIERTLSIKAMTANDSHKVSLPW